MTVFLGLSDPYAAISITRRIETGLKRRHCATSVSSFVVLRIRVGVTLYAALPNEAKVMVTVLTVHSAAKVIAPYERMLDMLPTYPFPD
ncbi:hypothetical protein TNCV_2033461 [Trichonephila clavipes]|nr:hypothetical protein TNCV_2033461 [Trichonephila clavipes]